MIEGIGLDGRQLNSEGINVLPSLSDLLLLLSTREEAKPLIKPANSNYNYYFGGRRLYTTWKFVPSDAYIMKKWATTF